MGLRIQKMNNILLKTALDSNFECIRDDCICNSIGSTKDDGSLCNHKCCNDDGSCTCIMGYVGDDCNTCDSEYYVSFNFNGENTCEGE